MSTAQQLPQWYGINENGDFVYCGRHVDAAAAVDYVRSVPLLVVLTRPQADRILVQAKIVLKDKTV